MQKILVTGAHGFIGSRLTPHLRERGYIVHTPVFDLLDFKSIESVLEGGPWDMVIHLAAISHVPTCAQNPALAFQTNLGGTALLLEAIRRLKNKVHFIYTSTAQVYAPPSGTEITDGVTFDENRAISPQNLYALTKWQGELLSKDWAEREGIKLTLLRLFNHTHHTQAPDFFLPHLYSTLKHASSDSPLKVPVGNLDLERDIGSIQDLIKAFSAIIEKADSLPRYDVFNICSGTLKNLRTLAVKLSEKMGLNVKFEPDFQRIRPNEPKSLRGSHQKLSLATGWIPECKTEEELLAEFLK